MKSVLVIGIGQFGRQLSVKMSELGNEVMVVDTDEEKLQDVLPHVTSAEIGDCTNEDVLRSMGVRNFDVCFVCVGDSFENSLQITSLLKELGAKHVISRASSDVHAKFLLRNGADEIAYPERDIAHKLAVQNSTNSLFDYFELTEDVSIYEIPPVESWVGRTIKEVNVRVKYQVSILATKVGEKVSPLPSADHVFAADEHLMILGDYTHVARLLKLIDTKRI